MSLETELTEIQGVGDATARKIMDTVEQHGESVTSEDIENLRNGIDYVESGQPSYALKFFRRVDL